MRRAVYTALVGVLAFIGVLATPSELFNASESNSTEIVDYDIRADVYVLENDWWLLRGTTDYYHPTTTDYHYAYFYNEDVDHTDYNFRFRVQFVGDGYGEFIKGRSITFSFSAECSLWNMHSGKGGSFDAFNTYLDVYTVKDGKMRLVHGNVRFGYHGDLSYTVTINLTEDVDRIFFDFYGNLHNSTGTSTGEVEAEFMLYGTSCSWTPYFYSIPNVNIPDINSNGLTNLNDFVLPTGLLSVLLVPFNQQFFLVGACLTLSVGVGAFMLFRGKGNK